VLRVRRDGKDRERNRGSLSHCNNRQELNKKARTFASEGNLTHPERRRNQKYNGKKETWKMKGLGIKVQ